MAEITVWGVRAGRHGEAETLFLKKNVIAIGWEKMGDLSLIAPEREVFKAKVLDVYPETKPGAVPLAAGQPFRFLYEMKIGDIAVYPSKKDRQIHIGVVEGEYKYDPSLDAIFPHMRKVKWGKTVLRTSFTQGALYEIGSAMSLFQVRNYADEFLAALQGKIEPIETETEDESVAYVVADIQQTTRDYIIKRLAQQLKGHPFAHFVAHLLGKMGYRTRVSAEGPDGGIDIIAHKDELGFEPPIIKVQVKSIENGSVGDHEVSALYGNLDKGDFALFVTLGTYSKPARNFARNKSNMRLIDGDELVNLVLQHYENFDSKYKGLLPLQKVYIPEALEEH